MYVCMYLFIYLFIYLHVFIYLFIHLFIYLLFFFSFQDQDGKSPTLWDLLPRQPGRVCVLLHPTAQVVGLHYYRFCTTPNKVVCTQAYGRGICSGSYHHTRTIANVSLQSSGYHNKFAWLIWICVVLITC